MFFILLIEDSTLSIFFFIALTMINPSFLYKEKYAQKNYNFNIHLIFLQKNVLLVFYEEKNKKKMKNNLFLQLLSSLIVHMNKFAPEGVCNRNLQFILQNKNWKCCVKRFFKFIFRQKLKNRNKKYCSKKKNTERRKLHVLI